jgi:hypothetical protein
MATGVKDANQARRLLALAAVCEGMSRENCVSLLKPAPISTRMAWYVGGRNCRCRSASPFRFQLRAAEVAPRNYPPIGKKVGGGRSFNTTSPLTKMARQY